MITKTWFAIAIVMTVVFVIAGFGTFAPFMASMFVLFFWWLYHGNDEKKSRRSR